MKVTLLGTGTSTGVPAIGCACAVCTSADPRNRRLRPSALVETGSLRLLIDTSPDFREQALRSGIRGLDAILFTHHHADHILGLDDIRPLNGYRGGPIPCYGSPTTLREIQTTFRYVFQDQPYGGVPQVDLRPIDGPFELDGLPITPLPVLHARLPVLGFRIGAFGYLTDLNAVPDQTLGLLDGLDLLVLGALRYEPHPAHFTIPEAVALAGFIGARRTLLTHLSHDVDHREADSLLPDGIELAYDGLTVDL